MKFKVLGEPGLEYLLISMYIFNKYLMDGLYRHVL